MNVFIIEGSEERGYAKGFYNQTLTQTACDFFKTDVEVTHVSKGYDIEEEVEKLSQADVVIFQFPIYWFHMPGKLKVYMDDVFMAARGKIWLNDGRAQGGQYGSGGLMQEKRYMLSLTWNAPEEAFSDPAQLFNGKTVDEAFFMFHKMMQFLGASALPSFSCHNIIMAGDITRDQEKYIAHLQDVFG